MANTMLLIPPTPAYPMSGTQPAQHGSKSATMENYFIETASQTYVVGDLIYLDSNGTVAICTTTSVGGVNQLNSAILGQPDFKATGTTGQQVAFKAFSPGEVYMMNIYHSTKASAVGTQAMMGTRRNIVKSAAGLWHVDIVNAYSATAPFVTILGFAQSGLDTNGNPVFNAAFGDTYAWAFVRFGPFFEGSGSHQIDALQMWA